MLLSPAAMARPQRHGFAVTSVALGQLGLLAFFFYTFIVIRRTIVTVPLEPYTTIAAVLYVLSFLILLPTGLICGIVAAHETCKNPLTYRRSRLAWKGIRLNGILLVLYFLLPYAQPFLAWLFR